MAANNGPDLFTPREKYEHLIDLKNAAEKLIRKLNELKDTNMPPSFMDAIFDEWQGLDLALKQLELDDL